VGVKRLAASLTIAGRSNGYPKHPRRSVVEATVRSYREAMVSFVAMRNLDLWYVQFDTAQALRDYRQGLDRKLVRQAEADLAKAHTQDSLQAFAKMARLVEGEAQLVSDPPLIVRLAELVWRGGRAGTARGLPADVAVAPAPFARAVPPRRRRP
jgi:hypothetical protein